MPRGKGIGGGQSDRSARIRKVIGILLEKGIQPGDQNKLARHFGVTRQNISQIVRAMKVGR